MTLSGFGERCPCGSPDCHLTFPARHLHALIRSADLQPVFFGELVREHFSPAQACDLLNHLITAGAVELSPTRHGNAAFRAVEGGNT